jgi:hypothetical protein
MAPGRDMPVLMYKVARFRSVLGHGTCRIACREAVPHDSGEGQLLVSAWTPSRYAKESAVVRIGGTSPSLHQAVGLVVCEAWYGMTSQRVMI